MRRPLVYVAGVPWDGVQGTDHRLVEHLIDRPILWVDPIRPYQPKTAGRSFSKRGRAQIATLAEIRPNLWRLAVTGPPAATRLPVRRFARMMTTLAISRAINALQLGAVDVICANPMWTFGSIPAGRRIFFATDDFIAGASLMGLSARHLLSMWNRTVQDADVVVAVSPTLAERAKPSGVDVRVLPNGCAPERFKDAPPTPSVELTRPIAGVIGQMNERLDLQLLEEVADSGASLLLVGPKTLRDSGSALRFDRLVAHKHVQWVGLVPYESVPGFAAAMDVGLTPYCDDDFNQASFPLKTLEYLSAGLPVVSTDLPSARWLQTPRVHVCARDEFVGAVSEELRRGLVPGGREASLAVAEQNSWKSRANELGAILDEFSF